MAIEKDNTARFLALTRKAVALGVTDGARQVAARMKRGMSKLPRFVSSRPGTPPSVQRGQLRNSITSTTASPNADKITASAGTNLIYGRIHENGGTIRAKSGKFLPVPLNNAAKRMLETTTGGLRSKNLKVIRTKTGKLILFDGKTLRNQKYEKALGLRVYGANGKAVFLLTKTVRIPKRPWAAPGLAEARSDGSLYKAIFAGARNTLRSFDAGVVT